MAKEAWNTVPAGTTIAAPSDNAAVGASIGSKHMKSASSGEYNCNHGQLESASNSIPTAVGAGNRAGPPIVRGLMQVVESAGTQRSGWIDERSRNEIPQIIPSREPAVIELDRAEHRRFELQVGVQPGAGGEIWMPPRPQRDVQGTGFHFIPAGRFHPALDRPKRPANSKPMWKREGRHQFGMGRPVHPPLDPAFIAFRSMIEFPRVETQQEAVHRQSVPVSFEIRNGGKIDGDSILLKGISTKPVRPGVQQRDPPRLLRVHEGVERHRKTEHLSTVDGDRNEVHSRSRNHHRPCSGGVLEFESLGIPGIRRASFESHRYSPLNLPHSHPLPDSTECR